MKHSLVTELLAHLLQCSFSGMVGALVVPYGQSFGRSLREIERHTQACTHDFSMHSRRVVSATFSKMKQRGLVIAHGPKKKTVWRITARGKQHFKQMNIDHSLPPKDGKIRLVIYDIPQKMNTHRVWLRTRLLVCEYALLQKSVWIGIRPLPKELRNELKERGILSYIHVVGLEGLRSDL